ncbi:MAG: hydrogenase maturation protease [Candidatus Omnitrophica bacterium]|nr:hydrogenase maturation protease [Candidatus Omnitrophota bacterium]
MSPEIIIIGVGSILRGDDGVGPRVIDELEKQNLPKNVLLHSGDICGLDLLKVFPGHDRVIIIDAARMGMPAGTVKIFNFTEIKKSDFKNIYSTHGMSLLETLTLGHELGVDPEIIVIGVEPLSTDPALALSPAIKAIIPDLIDKIKNCIDDLSRSRNC